MNKYREAFWNLEHDFDNYCCTQGQLTYEDMHVFEELVDKETPMETVLNRIDKKTGDYLLNECPNCEYEIDGLGDINYCPMCGQRLLFVEFEEENEE